MSDEDKPRAMTAAEIAAGAGITGLTDMPPVENGQAGSVAATAAATGAPLQVVPAHANGNGNSASNLRAAIFSGANKALRKKVIKFFGVDVEIRQQTLGSVSELAGEDDEGSQQLALAKTVIRYAYVPGSDEKVFGEEHLEELVTLPFNEDFTLLSETIAGFSQVSVASAEKK